MSDIALIRRAANLMHERASAAEAEMSRSQVTASFRVAAHVASWQPPVAMSVANLLWTTARQWGTASPSMRQDALRLARAYLCETE